MISSRDLIKTVITFRSSCLNYFPGDIDTLKSDARRDRLGQFTNLELRDHLLTLVSVDPIEHFIRLVMTPRLLKTIFRRTRHSWALLHGEIDFDDLLIVNAIRFAAPEAFDFILANYREIRGLREEGILKDKNERKEQLKAKWNRDTKNVHWDVTASEELLAFLFPSWDIGGRHRQLVPQGVQIAEPTDYWLRLNIEELIENEVRDQETLKAILEWKKDFYGRHFRGLSLTEALFGCAEFAPKFEQFAQGLLDGKDFRKLASCVFAKMIIEQGVKANADGCAGFIPLWRLAIRSPIDEDEHKDWIIKEIISAIPKSLRLANDLYYYWRHNSQADINIKRYRQDLRDPIIKQSKLLFEKVPNILSNALTQSICIA